MAGMMQRRPFRLMLNWRLTLSAVFLVTWGCAVIWGGERRFSGAAFDAPRALAPFWAWGAGAIAAGLLVEATWRVATPHVLAGILFITAIPLFVLAFALAISAYHSPVVALTGIPTYCYLAVSQLMAGVAVLYDDPVPSH